MVVTKCGDVACDFAGPGSSYVLRLTMAPTLDVKVALITDGQTDITPGGGISNTLIGNQTTAPLFNGNISISGATITRGAGSELGSFLTEGFQVGQLVTITGQSGNFTIHSVADASMTFTTALGAGPTTGVTISRVSNHGQYTGVVNFNDCAYKIPALTGNCVGTLTRADGSSWLDDGFLEGQMFQINGTGPLYKIQALQGTTPTKVDILVVTVAVHDPVTGAESVAKLPFAGIGSTTATLQQWAAQVDFTSGNWFVPLGIPVLADPYYNVATGSANLLEFPKVPHLLSAIKGPLSVDGADPGNDHTQLQMAVMLPHETNTLPFGIGIQPPESQQVNVLNIFDDGSQQDQTGQVNSTSVTGFGMGPGVDFTNHKGYVPGDPRHPTFGEPAKFPGGISFGSITIDPATGNFLTNASLSTVQVLNLMAGQGNDHITVSGSLVPGLYANPDGSLTTTVNGVTTFNTFVQGGLTMVQGGGAAQLSVINGTFDTTSTTIKRDDNLNWGDYEFAVGQELLWNGVPFGMITGVSGSTLTVAGAPPSIGAGVTGTISVFDPAIKSTSSFVYAGHTITRADLRSWAEFGFAVGQSITVDGIPVGTVTSITGPSNDVMTVTGSPTTGGTVAVASNAIRLGGNDITVTGGGGPGPGLTPPSVTGAFTEAVTGASTETLTRGTGSWITDGFVYGMVLQIAGVPAWTITGVSATTLDLTGPNTMPPTIGTSAQLVGFAPSPLVVYGSTSQDGIWYSGDPHTLSQRDFGSKPFPTQLGNGTPDFIFPVADPFKFAGNNVLDASADFPIASLSTGSVPNVGVPEGQVPTVGVTLYGGPGNNTIYGSQAPDFIAGGSGNTTIYGERGANQILGSDGINVDVITRAISFPTANTSVYPNADLLLCGQTPSPTCNNLIFGNTPGAGEVVTDRFMDYNNVIFGADGIVVQDTMESTVGVLGPSRFVTGLTLVSNVSTGNATLTCPTSTACFLPGDVSQQVLDSYGFLGAGTTILSINGAGTVATLSRNALNGASTNGLTVRIYSTRTVLATLTPNAASISNTVTPGTSSLVATLTCATACFQVSDVGLDVSDGGANISAGTVIVAVNSSLTVATLSRNSTHSAVVSEVITVGPPHGYCRPSGAVSDTPYCTPSGTTPFGDARVEKLQTTGDILSISSTRPQNHGNDTLYGSGADNVIVGGDGTNNIQGGPGRNLIIGGSVLLDRTTHLFNYTNPRFQDLIGTQIYNSCTYGTCGNGNGTPTNGSAFGQSMNDGTAQCDPTGHAWWGDFLSNGGNPGTPGAPSCSSGTGAIGITLSAPVGTSGWPQFLQDSTYKGADYIAGGSGSSYIFGESNNNIIQAHGSIDIAYPTSSGSPVSVANQPATGSETSGDPYAGASSCTFAGFYLGDRVGACRNYGANDPLPVDPTQPLQVNPSLDNYLPLEYTLNAGFTISGHTLVRTDGLQWPDSGFAVGDTVSVGTSAANATPAGVVTAISANGLTMTVSGLPSGSFVVATDGEAYVEGGRGNNVIFANQGQNDIVGGNSNLFSLKQPAVRASGSNLIFGGSGSNIGYGDCTAAAFDSLNLNQECVASPNAHAHDANVITSNNADVIRLVGTKSTYGAGNGVATFNFSSGAYLNYNYDLSGYPTATERIIARAVTVLDNTPGGPDLAGQTPVVAGNGLTTVSGGPLVTGSKATNGVGDIGGNPVPYNWGGNGQAAGTLQQGSEIHAESGDAFIYGGPADDMIYGGPQNDTIILGYGDNWVSGGRGDQCIIGGGGRCLTSRNGFSEPLYGIAAVTGSTTPTLNQLITTPGNAQQAVIDVAGALNYSALLYPYNWDPTTWASPGVSNGNPTYSTNCKENQICPTYLTVYGHNIIYGGWGNGVVHGGPGNSAISGAEAPTLGYTDNFNMYGNETAATYMSTATADTVLTDYVLNKVPIETDFFHPFNPGNAAGFMPNSDPPHGNSGRAYNIGKSLYFNAEDVRRQIELYPTCRPECGG